VKARGFTLIEVLVALVIVAFGMGAVLAALSSSADNISSLREKTLAQWVAMNQVADTRLSLNPPQPGVTEGDIKAFGNGDWHWRQDVIAMDAIPGMLEIAVRVQRLKPGSSSSSSGSSTTTPPKRPTSTSSSGLPGTFLGSSSSSSYSSGGFSSGLGQLSSSGSQFRNLGASGLPNGAGNQQWVATVIGFRGDALSPPNGVQPDWSQCNGVCAGGGSSGATSSSGTTVPSPAVNSSSGTTTTPIIGSSSGG
jgi:general secretion pathway protein I